MPWLMDDKRPIYIQIIEEIKLRIITGIYLPGSKIPSVRELASEANVNPNTMQKAFGELELNGLINTQRTSGRTVTENKDLIEEIKKQMAEEEIQIFLDRMKQLGYQHEDTLALLNKEIKGGNYELNSNL
jgi:DNA-binding transcriptional regulator YhcF (GntR family)